MKHGLALLFLCLSLNACKSPGTNTGNPDAPVNQLPGTEPGSAAVFALADQLCTLRKNCYQYESSNCRQDLLTTPDLAAIFNYDTQVSTWKEIQNGFETSKWSLSSTHAKTCMTEVQAATCDDPRVEAALNRSDFSNLDAFFETSPACRDIITTTPVEEP